MKNSNAKKGAFFAAVVASFGVLVITVTLIFVVSLPKLAQVGWRRLLGKELRLGRLSPWLLTIGPKCVALMEHVAFRHCLSVKSDVRGLEVFTSARGDEIYVLIANHPPLVHLFSAQAVATTKVGRGMAIAKQEFMTNPGLVWIGWAGYLAGLLIPINRGEVRAAEATTREAMFRLTELAHPTVVIVFPDGHRPTDKRVEETQVYLREKGHPPFVVRQFTDTALPKSGALWATLRSLEEAGLRERVRVIDGIYGLSTRSADLRDGWRLFGGTAYYRFADVTDQAWGWRSVEECRQWLLWRWVAKNQTLRRWYGVAFQMPD